MEGQEDQGLGDLQVDLGLGEREVELGLKVQMRSVLIVQTSNVRKVNLQQFKANSLVSTPNNKPNEVILLYVLNVRKPT